MSCIRVLFSKLYPMVRSFRKSVRHHAERVWRTKLPLALHAGSHFGYTNILRGENREIRTALTQQVSKPPVKDEAQPQSIQAPPGQPRRYSLVSVTLFLVLLAG